MIYFYIENVQISKVTKEYIMKILQINLVKKTKLPRFDPVITTTSLLLEQVDNRIVLN